MKFSFLKKLAMSTSALVVISLPAAQAQAQAQTVRNVPPPFACVQAQSNECHVTTASAVPRLRGTYSSDAVENTEGYLLRQPTSASPFKISVDGQTIAGSGFDHAAAQRTNDVALAATDIQVRFDGLDITPKLNVGLKNDAVTVSRNELMVFQAYSNYEAFIRRAEIRIFNIDQTINDQPLAIIPVDPTGIEKSRVPLGMDEVFYQ